MNEETDFWVLEYENRRRMNVMWAIIFGIANAFCLGVWVFDGSPIILFVIVLEYFCFLGFIRFAFWDTIALEAERRRQ